MINGITGLMSLPGKRKCKQLVPIHGTTIRFSVYLSRNFRYEIGDSISETGSFPQSYFYCIDSIAVTVLHISAFVQK
jgi:hypothetical protein